VVNSGVVFIEAFVSISAIAELDGLVYTCGVDSDGLVFVLASNATSAEDVWRAWGDSRPIQERLILQPQADQQRHGVENVTASCSGLVLVQAVNDGPFMLAAVGQGWLGLTFYSSFNKTARSEVQNYIDPRSFESNTQLEVELDYTERAFIWLQLFDPRTGEVDYGCTVVRTDVAANLVFTHAAARGRRMLVIGECRGRCHFGMLPAQNVIGSDHPAKLSGSDLTSFMLRLVLDAPTRQEWPYFEAPRRAAEPRHRVHRVGFPPTVLEGRDGRPALVSFKSKVKPSVRPPVSELVRNVTIELSNDSEPLDMQTRDIAVGSFLVADRSRLSDRVDLSISLMRERTRECWLLLGDPNTNVTQARLLWAPSGRLVVAGVFSGTSLSSYPAGVRAKTSAQRGVLVAYGHASDSECWLGAVDIIEDPEPLGNELRLAGLVEVGGRVLIAGTRVRHQDVSAPHAVTVGVLLETPSQHPRRPEAPLEAGAVPAYATLPAEQANYTTLIASLGVLLLGLVASAVVLAYSRRKNANAAGSQASGTRPQLVELQVFVDDDKQH